MRAHNTSDAMRSRSRVAEFYRLRSTTKLTECQMGSVVFFLERGTYKFDITPSEPNR